MFILLPGVLGNSINCAISLMHNYNIQLNLRGVWIYGVPVAFSSSPSLSCLNRRLKNPVSLSFVSFESFVGLEGSVFVFIEVLGVL